MPATQRSVSNGEISAQLTGHFKLMDERHSHNVDRLNAILEEQKRMLAEQKLTNGRLRSAETIVAIHNWALGLIGAGMLAWVGVWLTKVI